MLGPVWGIAKAPSEPEGRLFIIFSNFFEKNFEKWKYESIFISKIFSKISKFSNFYEIRGISRIS